MSTPRATAWLLKWKSGSTSAVYGKKPDLNDALSRIEPLYQGKPPPLMGGMRKPLCDAYAEGFHAGKSDRTFMPVAAAVWKLANLRAITYWQRLTDKVKTNPEINYTAAMNMLAFSVHGCAFEELSEAEQENCRRWARSTINAALEIE